ncbi:MAG: translation initiation factor IF-2 subunit beta [Nanoarchaeota archaeon]|nr:translation initiation factor IF-2 subunit beta [Nanoarchaeota archaeon]
MKYEELLKRAMSLIPKEVKERERFEIPSVSSSIQGNKTIIHNFLKICNYLNRNPKHVMKFFDRELATVGVLEDQRAVFVGRFSSSLLQKKLEKYVQEFVLCKECGKPDTKIVKEGRISMLKCTACGAWRPVRTIK